MSAQIATRMTCFAILSAIETDLRREIRDAVNANSLTQFLPEDVRNNATPRRESDRGTQSDREDLQLLDYMDFPDIAKVISRIKREIQQLGIEDVGWIIARLGELTSVRNRICHSRPLEVEDLPSLMDFAQDLISKHPRQQWIDIRSTLQRLDKEPTFVLYNTIPDYWTSNTPKVYNNLPLPEFDDTGFVGRKEDRRTIEKYLRSNHPVVTILGEGGAGKTALAQRCLYDLLDKKDCPYELIVWVSLKSRALNTGGIQTIKSAITNTAGLMDTLFSEFTSQEFAKRNPSVNRFESIIEQLETFKTLLAIDNLETVPAQELRELYLNVPSGSKILVTSRIGIGEAEVRYPLGALSPSDSEVLFRTFSRFLNKPKLAKAENSLILRYCERLHHNPLLIKWFVSSIAAGYDPNRLLHRKSSTLEHAIRFCFENLYTSLTAEQKRIIEVLSCAMRPIADPELRYLLRDNADGDKLQWALNLLHQSSMLRTEIETIGRSGESISKYSLTDIASFYIQRIAKPSQSLIIEVQKSLQELRWLEQAEGVRKAAYKYDPFVIHCTNKYERVAAKDLNSALDFFREGNFESAMAAVSTARSLAPGFSEVDRVTAMVCSESGDSYSADEAYQQALATNPQSGILLYTYANFLLRADRYEEGLITIDKALMLDPDDVNLLSRRAQLLVRLGRYTEAAPLYEKVLASVPVYEKWRLVTVKDSSECYRRWSENYSAQQDYKGAKEKLDRAIFFLETLSVPEMRTWKMEKQIWKVASDALYLLSTHDLTWSEKIVNWIEKLTKDVGRPKDELRGLSTAHRFLAGTAPGAKLSSLSLGVEQHGINPPSSRSDFSRMHK